jgi:L-ascorbate metabolism protein UlaG (beta-lactamase superfamily)
VPCGDFTVSFTQALHSSGTTKDGRSIYLGNPNGLVIRHRDAPTIYHMGDTELFGDMALIHELYAPKIAMVPVGDRFTMSGRTAALAVKRFFALDVAIPCHYATFGLLASNPDEFVAGLAGSQTKALAPKVGEAVTL